MENSDYTLAIVGVGPRGQYALECFILELQKNGRTSDTRIILFEETAHAGSGPVWRVDQPEGNWSNVTERVLVLPERPETKFETVTIPAFPSYLEWADLTFDPWPSDRVDTFPPRGEIGKYMAERFGTLTAPLVEAGIVVQVQDRVVSLDSLETHLTVRTAFGTTYKVAQVLLAVGHQPTVLDPQMEEWLKLLAPSTEAKLFPEAYPVETILSGVDGATDLRIAIRGFGLATIDLLRAFANRYGSFESVDSRTRAQDYVITENVKLQIAPFSLDGLTMGPKPLTPEIDAQFKPSDQTMRRLEKRLSDRQAQSRMTDHGFLLDQICPIIADVFLGLTSVPSGSPATLDEVELLVRSWIEDQTYAHDSILDTALPTEQIIDALLGMANGECAITLDYCAGQVWRHCHTTIYTSLSHSAVPDDAMAKIIATDESMKRYAFGPPAESLQQLKALYDAGILDFRFLDDPAIEANKSGWRLSNGSDTLQAAVMIDGVLDAPKIKDVKSELVTSLLEDGLLKDVHDDYGVTTASDAFVVNDLDEEIPVAVLGRLAKGTVIGVDAILECFGERPRIWARSAVKRTIA